MTVKRSRKPVVQVELMLNDTGNELKSKERLQPIPRFRPTALGIKRSPRIELLTRRPYRSILPFSRIPYYKDESTCMRRTLPYCL